MNFCLPFYLQEVVLLTSLVDTFVLQLGILEYFTVGCGYIAHRVAPLTLRLRRPHS